MQRIILDQNQLKISKSFEQLAFDLKEQNLKNFFKKLFFKQKKPQSLYVYGDVGRGKSMLMKNFFVSLQDSQKKIPKIYFHFNAFMKAIHEALRDVRSDEKEYKDELIEAVKRVVKNKKLLCLDEFQVLDIADAMILDRVFSYLFASKVTVVFTSNLHPLDLYKNGLQREVFLEFVNKVLLKNCRILNLDSTIDYRSEYRHSLTKRYFISDKTNHLEINQIIKNFVGEKKSQPLTLKVWGRDVELKKTFFIEMDSRCRGNDKTIASSSQFTDGRGSKSATQSSKSYKKTIAIFSFEELCIKNNRSASDFQEICKNIDLIFLLDVPQFLPEDINEAKRFMLLIDEIYENKVALIVLAKTAEENLLTPGQIFIDSFSAAFRRTISRLKEIKSDQYYFASKLFFDS